MAPSHGPRGVLPLASCAPLAVTAGWIGAFEALEGQLGFPLRHTGEAAAPEERGCCGGSHGVRWWCLWQLWVVLLWWMWGKRRDWCLWEIATPASLWLAAAECESSIIFFFFGSASQGQQITKR